MKIVTLVSRLLLGLMFLVFGLNGFLHFIPMGQPPPGDAGRFLGVMLTSHYYQFVSFFQVVCGVLLLVNQYVPLALAILGPILVNILAFHALMNPGGIGLGLFATLLWFVLFVHLRPAFAGLFQQKTAS